MIILGVDPGSRFCGYGIIQEENNQIVAAGCGTIVIKSNLSFPEKLELVFEKISELIKEYEPNALAIETVFLGKNLKSILILSQVRGVIILAAQLNNIPVYEYSPREIKKSVVGNGNASKQQVQYMIQKLIPLNKQPITNDASDGLAISYCHFNKLRFL